MPLTGAFVRFIEQAILYELLVDFFIFTFSFWVLDLGLAFGSTLHLKAEDFSVVSIDGHDEDLSVVQDLRLQVEI